MKALIVNIRFYLSLETWHLRLCESVHIIEISVCLRIKYTFIIYKMVH